MSERASGGGRPRSLRLPPSSPPAAGYRDKACAARSTDGLALASPHSTRAMREADARDCRGGRVFWITIVCVSDTSYLSNVVPPVVVVVDFFCFVFFYPRNAALEGISRRFLKGLAGRLSLFAVSCHSTGGAQLWWMFTMSDPQKVTYKAPPACAFSGAAKVVRSPSRKQVSFVDCYVVRA